jgi:hypothetical protein
LQVDDLERERHGADDAVREGAEDDEGCGDEEGVEGGEEGEEVDGGGFGRYDL